MDVSMEQWNCTLDHKVYLPQTFSSGGHLKSDVYSNHSRTNETLKGCIQEGYEKISMNILHAVTESAKHEVHKCKAFHGLEPELMLEKACDSGIVTLCITFLPKIPYILCYIQNSRK
jgi:hypothetical protein